MMKIIATLRWEEDDTGCNRHVSVAAGNLPLCIILTSCFAFSLGLVRFNAAQVSFLLESQVVNPLLPFSHLPFNEGTHIYGAGRISGGS